MFGLRVTSIDSAVLLFLLFFFWQYWDLNSQPHASFFSFIYMYIQCLGHFSPPSPCCLPSPMALCLLGRCSTALPTPEVLFTVVILELGSCFFAQGGLDHNTPILPFWS
jgi:hypothetical protein